MTEVHDERTAARLADLPVFALFAGSSAPELTLAQLECEHAALDEQELLTRSHVSFAFVADSSVPEVPTAQ